MHIDQLLTKANLAKRLSVSMSTITRWHRQGVLPPAIKLGRRAVRWRESAIDSWLQERSHFDERATR